jgi:hypothetical protein
MTAPQKSIDSSKSESGNEYLALDGQSLVCGDIQHMWREFQWHPKQMQKQFSS